MKRDREAEEKIVKEIFVEKLKNLMIACDTVLAQIFRKEMEFAIVIFNIEGMDTQHIYLSNVVEEKRLIDAFEEILDMVKNPKEGEQGFIEKNPTIQ